MQKIPIHLNQVSIQNLYNIKNICSHVKRDTTLLLQTYAINRNHYFKNLLVTMIKTKTNTTASADKEYGDCYFDISENSKRLVRATLKT